MARYWLAYTTQHPDEDVDAESYGEDSRWTVFYGANGRILLRVLTEYVERIEQAPDDGGLE